jgi:hypothetical protein
MLQELNLRRKLRRKQQRLTMLYKIVEGHVAALPPKEIP